MFEARKNDKFFDIYEAPYMGIRLAHSLALRYAV
jgi:hypothetical protein